MASHERSTSTHSNRGGGMSRVHSQSTGHTRDNRTATLGGGASLACSWVARSGWSIAGLARRNLVVMRSAGDSRVVNKPPLSRTAIYEHTGIPQCPFANVISIIRACLVVMHRSTLFYTTKRSSCVQNNTGFRSIRRMATHT